MGKDHFRFRNFTIHHDRCAMKVGTDAVIFGAWIDLTGAQKILDVGTGSGLIAIMLAQRLHQAGTVAASGGIDAIDIDDEAWAQACDNVRRCPWPDLIEPHHASLQAFVERPRDPSQGYDRLVCCPPYFTRSTQGPDQPRNVARHTEYLPPETLVKAAGTLLHEAGQIAVIYPPEEAEVFAQSALAHGWHQTRGLHVRGVAHKPIKRILSQWTRHEPDRPAEIPIAELAVETTIRHQMTPEHIALTREFYIPSHLDRCQDKTP